MRPVYAYIVLAVLTAGGAYCAFCNGAMTWDGAYQFCDSLIAQRPYAYYWRLHSIVLWWPTVWASRWTDNLALLRITFGLPYTLAPAVSAALCWWTVRGSDRRLFPWAVMGIALAPLPGQIFVINDSIIQQHLFWPVFVGFIASGKLGWLRAIALAVLSVFQLSHPIGAVLFVGTTFAVGLLAVACAECRARYLPRAALGLAGSALAITKFAMLPDPYAAQEATWASALQHWRSGVQGWVFVGLCCFYIAAVSVFILSMVTSHRSRTLLVAIASVAAFGGLGAWVYWASDIQRWAYASEFRRWLTPLTLPFFGLAWLEVFRRCRSKVKAESNDQAAGIAAVASAALFALILGIQSSQFAALCTHLSSQLKGQDQVILARADLEWTRHTPLDHWSMTALATALEDKTPSQFVVQNEADRAALLGTPARVALAPDERRLPNAGIAGWFDFEPLVQHARDNAGQRPRSTE